MINNLKSNKNKIHGRKKNADYIPVHIILCLDLWDDSTKWKECLATIHAQTVYFRLGSSGHLKFDQ